jgi:hypothetical protein
MTTPEQQATEVVKGFKGDEYWIDTDAAIVEVAAAIRAATLAAYKHAAQVAYAIESGSVTSQKTVARALQQLAKEATT